MEWDEEDSQKSFLTPNCGFIYTTFGLGAGLWAYGLGPRAKVCLACPVCLNDQK